MKRDYNIIAFVFWTAFIALIAVCGFFMIHNAAWIIGDESIVYSTTGMGKAFSPFGFDGMIDSYGRFYPFAYNLYNILLLFGNGQISVEAHYTLQAVALCIYALCFALVGLHLLKGIKPIWKYSITFCFVSITVFRVYPEFVTCYTGAWIIFMILAVFILCTCKFEETENLGWGIAAILFATYICYCYENICVIPLVYGTCSLLFNYKRFSNRKKWFNWLLVASGVLFIILYVVIVIPRATHFYGHHSENTLFINAFKMFVAQKIYWVALIFFVVRLWDIIKKKSPYIFADSFLLSSFAYFCGTALIHLNFTYYYNFGALLALTSIICYCREYLKPYWTLLLFGAFFILYGYKMPSRIQHNQNLRISTYTQMCQLSEIINYGEQVYWYAPEYSDPTDFYVDLRNCQHGRLVSYLEWLEQYEEYIPKMSYFEPKLQGIWLYPIENDILFPDSIVLFKDREILYDICGIKAYRVK